MIYFVAIHEETMTLDEAETAALRAAARATVEP